MTTYSVFAIVCNMFVVYTGNITSVEELPEPKCYKLHLHGFNTMQQCQEFKDELNGILENGEFIVKYTCLSTKDI